MLKLPSLQNNYYKNNKVEQLENCQLSCESASSDSEHNNEFGVEDNDVDPFNMASSSDEISHILVDQHSTNKTTFSSHEIQSDQKNPDWIKLSIPLLYINLTAIMQKAGEDVLAYIAEFWCSHTIAMTIFALVSVVGSIDGPFFLFRCITLVVWEVYVTIFHYVLLNTQCMYCTSPLYSLMRIVGATMALPLCLMMYQVPAFGNLVVTHLLFSLFLFFYLYTDSMGTHELRYRMSRPMDVALHAFNVSNLFATLLFGAKLVEVFRKYRSEEFVVGVVILLLCVPQLLLAYLEYVNQQYVQKYSVRIFSLAIIQLLLIFILSLVALGSSYHHEKKFQEIFLAGTLSIITTSLNFLLSIYRIQKTRSNQKQHNIIF